jgi:hypothetical protein
MWRCHCRTSGFDKGLLRLVNMKQQEGADVLAKTCP